MIPPAVEPLVVDGNAPPPGFEPIVVTEHEDHDILESQPLHIVELEEGVDGDNQSACSRMDGSSDHESSNESDNDSDSESDDEEEDPVQPPLSSDTITDDIISHIQTDDVDQSVRRSQHLGTKAKHDYKGLSGIRTKTRLGTVFNIVIDQELKKQQNLDRMTLNKSSKLFGEAAYDSAWLELKQLFVDKEVMQPLMQHELSYDQLRRIIRCSMFLKVKFDAQGICEKLKARLVAWGHTQDRSLYPDRSSPTVALPSVMMVLAQGAPEKRNWAVANIGGAYLTCEMTGDEVVIQLDEVPYWLKTYFRSSRT